MEIPRNISAEQGPKTFLETAEVVVLSPEKLVSYLDELEAEGRLEEFLERAESDESLLAQLSYWEKWLKRDKRNLVEAVVARKKEAYGEVASDSLPLDLEKKFDPEEISIIMSHIRAIQLTYGCSKGCAFCGVDAIKGAKEHIPYGQLANMYQQHGKLLRYNKPILYWASEPSDYSFEDKTYDDVHQLALNYADYNPHITSKESADKEWVRYLYEKGDARISAYGMSEEEVDEMGDMIPRIVGEGKEHIKGMGVSAKKFGYFEDDSATGTKRLGVACMDGLILTPRGLYNVTVVPISRENPQGQIIVPLEDIDDREPQVGDDIKELMRHGVVKRKSVPEVDRGFHDKQDRSKPNIYAGHYPLHLHLQQRGLLYELQIDEEGKVLSVKERGNRRLSNFLENKMEALQNLGNWKRQDGAGLGKKFDETCQKAIDKFLRDTPQAELRFYDDRLYWDVEDSIEVDGEELQVFFTFLSLANYHGLAKDYIASVEIREKYE